MADDDSGTKKGLLRFLSLKTVWKAIQLPWWVWACVLVVILLAFWVLLKDLVIYAVAGAVLFFGGQYLLNRVFGRRKNDDDKDEDERPPWSRIEPLSRR